MRDHLVNGQMCSLCWVPGNIGTKNVFQHMFEILPGIGWHYWQWVAPRAKVRPGAPVADTEVLSKQGKIRDAIQFLKDEAPRGNFDCEQTQWLECEFVNPDSPLQDLRRETVVRILQLIKDRDHVAIKQLEYPLCHPDIKKEYFDLLTALRIRTPCRQRRSSRNRLR